jgi:S-formylglutathione hydrolase FrmB
MAIPRSIFRFMFLPLLFASLGNLENAQSQFDERRRGDLAPLILPGGGTVAFNSYESACLGGKEYFSIFLPPSYAREPARTYPVIYFLHGLNNDYTSWTVDRYGSIQNKVEEIILSQKTPEFIMVHPDGDASFYCNTADRSRRYEDLITGELIKYMENNYRVKKERENRAIGGTSMGGFGALKIAMKYPDLYAATVGDSPIIFLGKNPLDVPEPMKQTRLFQFFQNLLETIFGNPFNEELWEANNPLVLAKSGKLNGLKIYFDYGTEDRYIKDFRLDAGVQALDKALTEANVPHTFKVRQGEPHGWALVAAHIEESMEFLSRTFK